jgi:hypothetical protein
LAHNSSTIIKFAAMAVGRMPPKQASHKSSAKPRLPDSAPHKGPFKPFASDPGWGEAWWWLGIPALLAIFLIATQAISREFYATRILPEGYGFLELGQFFIAFAGMMVALRLLFRPFVRARRLVFAFVCIAALGCLYIAGEEHSWGQHFFQWQTPEYWAAINRQQETNLHNTMHLFGKKPRAALEVSILVGGLILPLLAFFKPAIRANRWSLFIPAFAVVPTVLGAILFKSTDALQKKLAIPSLVMRPSEATEIFLYLFLLFYLILFTRRITELEREAGKL